MRPADEDVERALEQCLELGDAQAGRFIDALDRAYRRIGRHPGSGSPRYGELLGIAGVRHVRCGKLPYLVFHFEHADHVEVWRVLHGASDLPPSLRDES